MRNSRPSWCISCAVAIAGVAGTTNAQTLHDYYSDATLDNIRLTMTASDWQSFKTNYLDNTWYSCDWQWRNVTIKGAGCRQHGHGSRSGVKPAMEVKFNHYTKGQKFFDAEKTYLKNSAEDASFLRDTLSFKVNHRMGLPYIRTAFTRLFVNGAYQGLYEKYEAQDDTDFLKRMFGESGGYLYDFSPDPNGYHFEDRGSDPATYA